MNVAIIDNHALFREGITALLERQNISVVAFTDGKHALDELANFELDIVLLDIRMPKLSGIETLIEFKKRGTTKAAIVMLTTSCEEDDLKQCLKHGAQGYLLKDMQPDELVECLNDIQKGNIVVAKDMTHLLAKIAKNELDGKKNVFQKLSPKEQSVACLIVDGLNNKLIAKELNISDGTVKLHVKSILKKSACNSRVEVAVIMVEGGYCKNRL